MGFWRSVWFFVKDTFHSRGKALRASDSLAKTIREASHVRGGHGGLARSASEEVLEHASEGHEEYRRSFEDDRDESS